MNQIWFIIWRGAIKQESGFSPLHCELPNRIFIFYYLTAIFLLTNFVTEICGRNSLLSFEMKESRVKMMSSRHGPYEMGHTCATIRITKISDFAN
jgi:hypothetical protein